MSGFTFKQRVVLNYLIKGHNNREIAKELGVEESTVKTHISHIYKIYGCNRKVCLAISYYLKRDQCTHRKIKRI